MTEQLDLRGLRCPLPVLRLEARMRRMSAGETVTVLADDPLARIDIPHAAKQAGLRCEPVPTGDMQAFAFRVLAP